ncbi:hypothetical protein E2C01_076020 [Portunus trituberculatus]|uniref:Uncharacterized protein n=1 Tax=Portunus trituberculatus TaxID=210409 RepID=A0A5B7IM54_PORTR|nr:hypothetical protein [Portunus trituberculatus]
MDSTKLATVTHSPLPTSYSPLPSPHQSRIHAKEVHGEDHTDTSQGTMNTCGRTDTYTIRPWDRLALWHCSARCLKVTTAPHGRFLVAMVTPSLAAEIGSRWMGVLQITQSDLHCTLSHTIWSR